jgi:hypothetical protein
LWIRLFPRERNWRHPGEAFQKCSFSNPVIAENKGPAGNGTLSIS